MIIETSRRRCPFAQVATVPIEKMVLLTARDEELETGSDGVALALAGREYLAWWQCRERAGADAFSLVLEANYEVRAS